MKRLILMVALLACTIASSVAAETETNTVLTAVDKTYLLNLARQTVYWHLKHHTTPVPAENALSANVRRKLGCFVTLKHKQKGLRGCIGIFDRSEPLYRNVITRAIAATHDGRFRQNPVTYQELKDIELEISVLTEPEPLSFTSSEDLLDKLRPLVHGVILLTRYGNSTYLPQVWEQIPDKRQFLSYLCRKHGAPMDTWKKENVRVQTYRAIVFHEDAYGRKVVGPNGALVGPKGAAILGRAGPLPAPFRIGGPLAAGTRLPPGTIVTWQSDTGE